MKHLYTILLLLITFIPSHAHAEILKIDITKGSVSPLPIAITHFGGNNSFAQDIAGVIKNDLQSSGLFNAVDPKAFIQKINNGTTEPHFADWRKIDTQAIITADVENMSGGKIKITFSLYDVFSSKKIIYKYFIHNNWRRLAHKVADEIYSRLTGEDPYFDSRIIYIAESGNWKKRTKRLAIMDQDGANHQFLTNGKYLELTPRFDKKSQRIIYMAYYNNRPRVYLYDLQTGKEKLLGSFKNMTFSPRFSPDGRSAILSAAMDGKSKIYSLDLNSGAHKQISWGSSIDTSPSYSPDGKRITFNSDRGGSQQIYVMDKDGNNVKRISLGKGSYATPVWSPRGDLIAFTRMYNGKFYIGVMRPDGSGERLLTESYLDEGPTWSPNGRVIMFTRQSRGSKTQQGKTYLYSIDLTGYNERKIKTPGEASDPAWSPLL